MWTTEKELKYIQNIGKQAKLNKEECLKGYIEGCKKRANWEGMDKRKIIEAAKRELKNNAKGIKHIVNSIYS